MVRKGWLVGKCICAVLELTNIRLFFFFFFAADVAGFVLPNNSSGSLDLIRYFDLVFIFVDAYLDGVLSCTSFSFVWSYKYIPVSENSLFMLF